MFDIGQEDRAIHRTVNDHGRGETLVAQSGDERGRLPMAVRNRADQPPYCAKFEAVTKPGITYRIAVKEKALVLEDDNREVVANITKLRPVPFGNIITSTPTDCS